MHFAPLCLLLLLAPDEAPVKKPAKAYTLRYVSRKGDKYVETSERSVLIEQILGKSLVTWDIVSKEVLERTILEVKDQRPDIERVIVREMTKHVKKSPDQRNLGEEKSPATGARFVWRRVGERWGLFGQRSEVTDRHRDLVSRLKSWPDARLPKKPVKAGDKWVMTATEYLETVGQPVPPGTEGRIAFTLEKVDAKSVATIVINGAWTYRIVDVKYVVKQKGTWRFDIKRGRDLSLAADGEIDISGSQEGKGRMSLKRLVTWADAKKPK